MTIGLRVAARYVVASLLEELRHKMGDLLKDQPLDAAKGEALAAWFGQNFYILSPKTPKGQKAVKDEALKLHWWLKAGIRMTTDPNGARASVEDAWGKLEPHLAEFVKSFSAEGGKVVPKEFSLEGNTFINGAGLDEKKLQEYAERMLAIFKDLKGWRKGALAGGVKVLFASPKDFTNTAGGKYKSDQDTLYVRTTPTVLKREGTAYAGFEYIIVHELGHRYEHKHHLSVDFDNSTWWTTPYSKKEGEAFAELFALTNFGITSAHTSWGPELNERFEQVMTGHEKTASWDNLVNGRYVSLMWNKTKWRTEEMSDGSAIPAMMSFTEAGPTKVYYEMPQMGGLLRKYDTTMSAHPDALRREAQIHVEDNAATVREKLVKACHSYMQRAIDEAEDPDQKSNLQRIAREIGPKFVWKKAKS